MDAEVCVIEVTKDSVGNFSYNNAINAPVLLLYNTMLLLVSLFTAHFLPS
jgi:hypothetical protein